MKTNWRFMKNFALSVSGCAVLVMGFQNCGKMQSSHSLKDASSNGDNGPSMNAAATPFECKTETEPAPIAMRRLTKVEYVNTMKSLLRTQAASDQTAILAGLAPLIDAIPEDSGAKFSRTDSKIDQQHISAYFYVADRLGALLTASDTRAKNFFGTCAGVADLSVACLNQFLTGFATKIYRRPLSTAEADGLRANFGAFEAGTRNAALIARMFTSPRFLMLVEDAGTDISPTLLQISPYELASRLSYHILSNMPDDELMAAAANGSLMQDAVLKAQIDRLLSGANLAAAQSSVAEFYSQWLGLNQLAVPETAMGAKYTAFANGATLTKASMAQEIQDMVYYYTFTQNGTFNDLLVSPFSFAKSADLASIYGVTPWNGNPSQMVRMPAGERSGLLTRAAFLVNGSSDTNPVKRGLMVRQAILCDVIPAPPASIANQVRVPEPDPNLTTRQRFEHKTSPALCMGCHQNINPLGFALESFDALGRYRVAEKIFDDNGTFIGERRVDPIVQPLITHDDTRTSSNAVQFNQILADSGKAQKCFVQQYFNFTYRQPADIQADGCALEDLRQNLSGPEGSLRKALNSVPLSRAFKLKKLN